MEYCDAGTLEDVSAQGLPEVSIQQYTSQLLCGVLVLHDKGIVHRDIKGTHYSFKSSRVFRPIYHRKQTMPYVTVSQHYWSKP